MDKRYRDKGLTVIGAEVQGSDLPAIEKVIKDARAEFSVTKGTTRPPTLRGIPHAVIFDPAGKLVFAGHPMDDNFDRIVKKALKEVKLEGEEDDAPSGPVIASRTWTNAEGKAIKAAVMSIDGDKVEFQLPNGRRVPYEIAKLSDADQELIKEAAGPEEEDE
ncbi:MAG: hypothetical protein HKN82_09265 [Akkermansiaceae bacterium]|nr:hypothetical protein [Akkermansiaceae bacterium]NNM28631.1 hypothetical protein [Akkermansiaceae bacterium]